MAEKINWTLSVQIIGGPRLLVSKEIDVDAYDKIEVAVENGAKNKIVEVQPGGEGQVKFLLIKPDPCNEELELSYSVNEAVGEAKKRIKLDKLQLLIGDGAVGLLGESPKTLHFYNESEKDASIGIIVGRQATKTGDD